MAPRKPAVVDPKSKKTSTAKQGNGRIVKRPARGYHTFKNGMLNVTPKGGEKDIVKINQASPLLRLPGEIRNRIFQYALGGKVIRECQMLQGRVWRYKLLLEEPKERHLAFALLRTSRQIYAEASLVPYAANAFTKGRYSRFDAFKKRLKRYQRSQIRQIRVEVTYYELQRASSYHLNVLDLHKWFPGLQQVHICVFPLSNSAAPSFPACVKILRTDIEPMIRDIGCDMTIEEMAIEWGSYDKGWGEGSEKTEAQEKIIFVNPDER